jgi:hypothetical protein
MTRRGAGIILVIAVTATLVASCTATTAIPTSNAGASRQALAVSQLTPAGRNSLVLTGVVRGSGTLANSQSNALILGSRGLTGSF